MKDYNGFSAEVRNRALIWSKKEIAAGRRRHPSTCCACGQTQGIIDAHSEDYSEPFGDHIGKYGLCFVCHMMLHCRFTAPEQWQSYRTLVSAGVTFAPITTRNFTLFVQRHLGALHDSTGATISEPRGRTLLDEVSPIRQATMPARQLK